MPNSKGPALRSGGKVSQAGKEVLAYCTSCRMDLNHTIIAMTGSIPAKVECRTCGKPHQYRAPKGLKEPESVEVRAKKTAAKKSGSSASSKNAEGSPIELEWRKLMIAHKNGSLKPYSAKGSFKIGDRIDHSKFGEGIVAKLHYPNKIEVVFQHDMLLLIHTPAT